MDLRRACGCVVLLFAVSVVGPEGRSAPRVLDVRSLVRNVANFTDADWAAVENGAPVAKVLETDAREVAIAGAVRIAAPRERLVAPPRCGPLETQCGRARRRAFPPPAGGLRSVERPVRGLQPRPPRLPIGRLSRPVDVGRHLEFPSRDRLAQQRLAHTRSCRLARRARPSRRYL